MASLAPQLSTATISNFRDVAHTINAKSQLTLSPSLLYRSALPSTASATARARLSTTYSLSTILDLRTDTEILEQKRTTKKSPSPSPTPSTIDTTTPTIATQHISLNGSSYSRALLKRLTYMQTAKLALLYALSYRTQAISILGTNVMAKRGLSGLAIDTLTYSTVEIASVFSLLADPTTYPVLVHCTQGKDRTGLVILLVCLLCGVSEEAIREDYERSEVELEPERVARVEEISHIGLPASFAGCEDGWVGVVCGWLQSEWGGLQGYLGKGCGVSEETMEGVRRILVC